MSILIIPWEQVASALRLDYRGPDDFTLSDDAGEQALQFKAEFDADADQPLTDEELDEVRFAIESAMSDHWSLQNVLSGSFLENLLDDVNEWGRRGMQSAIYEGIEEEDELPREGEAVRFVSEDADGVKVELLPGFEVAYAEAAFCVHGTHFEGRYLDHMDASDVFTVARWIRECEGQRIRLDLDRWDDQRTRPTYNDLVKMIDEMRRPKKQRRKRARERGVARLPTGWTIESAQNFWNSVGGTMTGCIRRMEGSNVDDPAAFCGNIRAALVEAGVKREDE